MFKKIRARMRAWAVATVLDALAADGRMLPPGGFEYFEYGVFTDGIDSKEVHGVGIDEPAKKYSTHQRTHTVWPDENPSDQWAIYTTSWKKK